MWPPLLVAVLALRLYLSSYSHLCCASALLSSSQKGTATGSQAHPAGLILTSSIYKDLISEKGLI